MREHQIRYVVYRYSHHSPHSGYSRIAEFGKSHFGSESIVVDKPLSRRVIRERMLWRLAKGTPGYNRSAMAAELKVAKRILREQGNIFHFLYGETNYHYAGYLNNFRQNRVVASFHQPLTGFQRAVEVEIVRKRISMGSLTLIVSFLYRLESTLSFMFRQSLSRREVLICV
jgi:hypothetical protein